MKKAWFDHVATTRKKMSRKSKNLVSHREAMKASSITWPKQKAKLQRKNKRLTKKIQVTNQKRTVDKTPVVPLLEATEK